MKGGHNHQPNFTPDNFQAPLASVKKFIKKPELASETFQGPLISVKKLRKNVKAFTNKWHTSVQCSDGWKIGS